MISETWSVTKRDPQHRVIRQYEGQLVTHGETHVVLKCLWTESTWPLHDWEVKQGDTLIEWFSCVRWFNILEIRSPEDTLRGWYCNLTMPAIFRDHSVTWDDLALDVIVNPDRTFSLDDTAEFRALDISLSQRRRVISELKLLLAVIRHGPLPLAEKLTPPTIESACQQRSNRVVSTRARSICRQP